MNQQMSHSNIQNNINSNINPNMVSQNNSFNNINEYMSNVEYNNFSGYNNLNHTQGNNFANNSNFYAWSNSTPQAPLNMNRPVTASAHSHKNFNQSISTSNIEVFKLLNYLKNRLNKTLNSFINLIGYIRRLDKIFNKSYSSIIYRILKFNNRKYE